MIDTLASASNRAGGAETSAQPPIVVDARNLTKTYHLGQTSVHALRGVTLTIHRG